MLLPIRLKQHDYVSSGAYILEIPISTTLQPATSEETLGDKNWGLGLRTTDLYVRWAPHPVIVLVTIRDNRDCIRVYQYYRVGGPPDAYL